MKTINEIQETKTFTKSKVSEMAQTLINEASNGNIDVLSTLAHLEFMSQVIENAKDEFRKKATTELDAYGVEAKTGVVKNGVTFQQKEVGVRYNFENTPAWQVIKNQEDECANARKELEEQLKLLKGKQTILDENTGELVELYPPLKTSKTSVQITLPK